MKLVKFSFTMPTSQVWPWTIKDLDVCQRRMRFVLRRREVSQPLSLAKPDVHKVDRRALSVECRCAL